MRQTNHPQDSEGLPAPAIFQEISCSVLRLPHACKCQLLTAEGGAREVMLGECNGTLVYRSPKLPAEFPKNLARAIGSLAGNLAFWGDN